jgi:hypothetical protein
MGLRSLMAAALGDGAAFDELLAIANRTAIDND